MKILFIITRSEPIGGAQVHVLDLAKVFHNWGHEVEVCVGDSGLFTSQLQANGIPCKILPHLKRAINPYADLLALAEIRDAVKKFQPNIIATHSSKAGWLGRIAGGLQKVPTTFTAHGWAFTEGVSSKKRYFYTLAEKLAAPMASRIITVSEYDRNLALRSGVGDEKQLITIYNGVPDISTSLQANLAVCPPRLIMVARMQKPKDHVTLFQALIKVRDLDWQIDLVGDGPLRQATEEHVSSLGLTDRVSFLGEREDVAELLAHSQLFLLISNWEGFPISILEAMRAGLPVIASDVGGIREAVVDGQTGFLVPRGEVGTLAQRLRELITSPALRATLGETGRMKYLANYQQETCARKTLQVYFEVLKDIRSGSKL